MKFKKILLTTATTALLLSPAYGAIKLDEIVVKGPTWNPLDSGRNDYNNRKINTYLTPSQDFKDLFRTDANVQFNDAYKKQLRNDDGASEQVNNNNVQKQYTQKVLDQRPASIAISGGKFYENNLTVDGRYSSSRLSPNLDEVAIKSDSTKEEIYDRRRAGSLNRSSDSQWVKPFDVEKAKIYDSNIPAQYGKFSGGVVDVKTKKPTGKQNFTFYYDIAGSKYEDLKYYNMEPTLREKWTSYNTGGRFNSNEYTIADNVKMSIAVAQDRGKRTAKLPTDYWMQKLGKSIPDQASSISTSQDIKGKFKFRHDTDVDVTLNKQKYSIENFPMSENLGVAGFDENLYAMDIEKRLGDIMSVNVNKKLTGGRTVNVGFSNTSNTMLRNSLTGWDLFTHDGGQMTSGGTTYGSYKPNCGNLDDIGVKKYIFMNPDLQRKTGADGCTIGGYGNADEIEKKRSVNFTYGMPSKWGRLEIGTSLQHDNLQFNRNRDSHQYSYKNSTRNTQTKQYSGSLSGSLICTFMSMNLCPVESADGKLTSTVKSKYTSYLGTAGVTNASWDSLRFMGPEVKCEVESDSCKTGDYAFYHRKKYAQKNVKVTGTERNAYMQLTRKLENKMTMRAGIRYDYDTLLKNSVFAPRLSLNHKINGYGGQWATTYGLNRYYANSNATYHLLRDAVGAYTSEWRKMKLDSSGNTVWTDEWFTDTASGSQSDGAAFKYAGLKTPHKDELSVATQSPEFGMGQFRFKYVDRHGRNEFSTRVYGTNRTITNEGWSKYRSLAVEYQKTWGSNTFFANTTFASTKSNTSSFIAEPKEKLDTELVYYKGQLYKKADITKKASSYNEPQVYNFGYSRYINTGNWGGVMAGITGRYTESYEKIGLTYYNGTKGSGNYTADQVTIGGEDYYVYDDVKYPSRIDLNGRLSWNIARNGESTGVQVYTGINNLFNKRYKGPKNGKPKSGIYRGRSFTFGTQISF